MGMAQLLQENCLRLECLGHRELDLEILLPKAASCGTLLMSICIAGVWHTPSPTVIRISCHKMLAYSTETDDSFMLAPGTRLRYQVESAVRKRVLVRDPCTLMEDTLKERTCKGSKEGLFNGNAFQDGRRILVPACRCACRLQRSDSVADTTLCPIPSLRAAVGSRFTCCMQH